MTAARFVTEQQRLLLPDMRNVEAFVNKAIGYVWGFIDAGGKVGDREAAHDFAWTYGIVAIRYEAGETNMMPDIAFAWRTWQEHGEIRDYSGNRLDGPEE